MNKGVAEDKLRIDHTPTPWHADYGSMPEDIGGAKYLRSYVGPDGQTIRLKGFSIAGGNTQLDEPIANAEFIVKAVNMHQELVDALHAAIGIIGHPDDRTTQALVEIVNRARTP